MGFLLASILGTFLNSYFTLPTIFFFLGLMLLVISIKSLLNGFKKP
jgi:tellurite resistance protein TehA-like permease